MSIYTGLDIAIPYDGDPDPTLPWADDDDALLVPGSLALFEPAHSSSPIIGVPALAASVPNIAHKRFADLIGSASFTASISGTTMTVSAVGSGALRAGQTIATGAAAGTTIMSQTTGTPGGAGDYVVDVSQSVSSTAMSVAAITSATPLLVRAGVQDLAGILITERTEKGGIHAIWTQANDTVNNRGFAIAAGAYGAFNSPLHNYLAANAGHSYYYSCWDRVTRVGLAGEPDQATILMASTSSLIAAMAQASFRNVASSTQTPAAPNSLGNRFRSAVCAGKIGTPTRTNSYTALTVTGCLGVFSSAASYGNKSASRIVYRAYLEDLTVSGRSYDEVDALDRGLWEMSMSAGGRYFGDTFTDPSTLP